MLYKVSFVQLMLMYMIFNFLNSELEIWIRAKFYLKWKEIQMKKQLVMKKK